MENYYALMRETDYPETPVWVSEWNTSLSERNIYNDSCAKACHMLTQMVDAADRICRMSYWGISDCPSQYFDSAAPLIGATGLITRDALLKPAYYAFEFWKQLGERMLGKGEHYIATSQHGDSVQILTFNAKQFSYGYQLKDEDRLAPGELPFVFRNSHRLELTFALEGMKKGKKKICIYRVGEVSGNVLAEWKKLGYANDLLRSEIAYLQKICIPRMEVLYQEVTGGILELDVMLEANEMALILVFCKDYP
jgi:xylan 1,4-beta-xylosidase